MIVGKLKALITRWDPRRRSEDYRRSVRNAAFNAGEGVVTPLLWVISTPIFVRQLGTDHFGIWMLVNSVIGAGGLLSLGLTDATTKYVSKYRALSDLPSVRRVTQATLFLYLLLGTLGALIVFAIAPYLAGEVFKLADADRPVARLALQIGGLGILARFVDNVFLSIFQGFERYDLNARLTVLMNSVTMIVNIALALSGSSVGVLLFTTVSFIFLGALLKAVLIHHRVDREMRFTPHCTKETFKELISYGFYSWAQRALGLMMNNLDRILIGAYAGMSSVAYYTVCLQVLTQLTTLFSKASAFLFPLTSTLQEQGDDRRLRSVYNKSQVILVVAACSVMVPVHLYANSILTLWMGSDFALHATVLLQLLTLRFAFAPLQFVNVNYLLGLGMVKLQAFLALLYSTTLLACMFLLIPKLGPLGAAVAHLSFFPFMLLNRYMVDRFLFKQLSIAKLMSFYIPLLVCLAISAGSSMALGTRHFSVLAFTVALPVSVVAFAALGWLIASLCRRASLMPH